MMRKIGYGFNWEVEEDLKVQMAALNKYGCDMVVIEEEDLSASTHPDVQFKKVLTDLTENDQLVIYDLLCLGKSIIQLTQVVAKLKEKRCQLVILEEGLPQIASSDQFLDMILEIGRMEKEVIRMRTARGLKVARDNGRIGGRPRVSQETIKRIELLYMNNKHTLRQIAEECQVSLGTAYKYTQGR